MTENKKKTDLVARLDRPGARAPVTIDANLPWITDDRRGALDLPRDGSQHRRYASLFEDLLN